MYTHLLKKKVKKIVIKSLNNFYSNSLNTDNTNEKLKFKENMINKFIDNIKAEDYMNFSSQSIDKRETYKPLLLILREIQIAIINKKDYSFNFKKFIDYLRKVKLQDIGFINNYIEQTINDFILCNANTINKFYLLIIANNLLKNVIQNLSYVEDSQKMNNLHSPDLLEISELTPILTRINFLSNIVSESAECFSLTNPTLLLDNEFCNIISIISNLKEKKNLDYLSKLISIIHKNKEKIKIINEFFPFNYFALKKEYKLICHFFPLIIMLNDIKNDFNIIISGTIYDFKYNNNSYFIPTFSFNDYNRLLFGIGTHFQFGDISKLSQKEAKKYIFSFPLNLKIIDEIYNNSLMFIYLCKICLKGQIKQTKNLKTFFKTFNDDIDLIDSELNERCIYLNDFYINDNGPMIAKIWNLEYFINDKNVINNLVNILNKVESNILDVVSKLFDDINFEEIDLYTSFTKKMVNFCLRNSILWKTMFYEPLFKGKKETKEEALDIKEKIKNEKSYIESILPLKNIWKNDEYIKYLDKNLELINKIILKLDKEKEKLIIDEKIGDLISKLNNKKIDDESMSIMRKSIIEVFEKGERTKDFLAECESRTSVFLKSLNSIQLAYKNNIFPSYYSTIDYSYKNKKTDSETYSDFFNCLIWFSENYSLLKNYFENNKNSENSISICQKFIKNGLKIINDFINYKETNRLTITAKETEKLFSIIKMHFLNKLIENNCYEKIIIMKKIFNDIKERFFLKEEDYKWIFNIANKYPLDFHLTFPDFNSPNDMLFLFLSISEDPSNYKEGPMKIGEKDNQLIDELKDYVNSEICSYEDCANKIAKAIYHVYINKTEKLANDNVELKSFFDDKINEYKGNAEKNYAVEILKNCIFILKIGEDLSKKEETELEIDDMEFLNSKVWEFGNKITKKYPSFVFWLIKNGMV